jgi:hypothetical protein
MAEHYEKRDPVSSALLAARCPHNVTAVAAGTEMAYVRERCPCGDGSVGKTGVSKAA